MEKFGINHGSVMKSWKKGGKLELIMGEYPNKSWASLPESIPPSFEMVENRDSL